MPKPRFLKMKIKDAGIGTFTDVATVSQTATVYDALSVFVERRVSALPVVDDDGTLHSITVRNEYITRQNKCTSLPSVSFSRQGGCPVFQI